MSENTKIEWADHTFNPWEGCQKVGPGCDHCYAETRNARFGGGTAVNWGPGAPRRRTSAANWRKPLQWQARAAAFKAEHGRRQRVFCASLADWLDNEVPAEWLCGLLDTISLTPDLDWLLLSKRIGNWRKRLEEAATYRLAEVLANAGDARTDALWQWIKAWLDGKAPANVVLMATIVNQPEADRDLPKLLAIPAAARGLSMEPLLGPVDLSRALWRCCGNPTPGRGGDGWMQPPDPPECCGDRIPADALHWVIAGGESGPGARPSHPDWFRSLREQCAAAGVPYLFKQWGEWTEQDSSGLPGVRTVREGDPEFDSEASKCDAFMAADGHLVPDIEETRRGVGYRGLVRIGKKAAGRQLDGRTHDGFPTGAAP